MQNNPTIAPHELLELHELMNAGIVGAKKTKVSMSMVQDQELKSFMQESFNSKKSSLKQMQDFLTNQINIQGQNNNQNNQQNQQNQNNNQGQNNNQTKNNMQNQSNGGNGNQ